MRFSARTLYRSRQFFRSVGASIDDEERAQVEQLLGEKQCPLFFSMTARDQRHSVDVFRVLLDGGCEDADLLSAALLHDAGKGRVRLWDRVVYVLVRALSPRLLRKIASDSSTSWRGALSAIADHAARGALLVEAAGASADLVRLVRCHESADDADPRLQLLRAADESC